MNNSLSYTRHRSFYLPIILIFSGALLSLSLALVQLASLQRKVAQTNQQKISALGVAEAGINYYLWHLSHNPDDMTDGNGAPVGAAPYGPYVHDYKDASANTIGTFSLKITPPANGSTVSTVESTGTLAGSNKTRTVKALLGIPSFSQYALVTASEVWFGPAESSNGPVHSNVGVHYDGVNNGLVSSANATYTPSGAFGGNGAVHNGVWGNGGPQSQWVFPVPPVNFQNITTDLQQLKTTAQANGKFLPASTKQGYYIQFQNDGTYKLATVTALSVSGITTGALVSQPVPANGVIYVDDHVWVEGTVKGRYTVVAATLPANPSTNRNITVTNNLLYTTKNGADALGLVAQNDVRVSPQSPDFLEIDAAMLAQNGHVYRPNCWNDVCSGTNTYNIRNTITTYGSIGSFSFWNWTWVNGNNVVSGYRNTIQTYDSHMLFSPPPSFPVTGKYTVLSWREVLVP